jgi:hypothetical protein
MPTVVSISRCAIEGIQKSSFEYKKSSTKENALQLIKLAVELTDGSIVAASKLLHFMFPADFPIYDSHIYRYLWNKNKVHH